MGKRLFYPWKRSMMFSSQACSGLHSHQKLSPCRWSSSGPSLTGERGSTVLGKCEVLAKKNWSAGKKIPFLADAPFHSPLQLLTYKKAHPKRHLACAIVSSLLFFVTGEGIHIEASVLHRCLLQGSSPSSTQPKLCIANEVVITNKRWSIRVDPCPGPWQPMWLLYSFIWPSVC